MTARDDAGPTISYNQLLVLHALDSGCRYGFEVMRFTELSAGTVYPILRRFEARGLIASSKEEEATAHAAGRPARRMHELQPEGRAVLIKAREAFIARQRAMGLARR
jgi:DNA-binding PadR family transcriptional regulator